MKMGCRSFADCVNGRRSIRLFTDEKVDRALVRVLLEDAILAPSASNIQPWRFILVDDPDMLRKIKAFSPGIGGMPPVLLVFCLDGALLKNGKDMAVCDIAMAVENLMLSAVCADLGTCAVKSFQPALISRLLDLPESVTPELIVTLGHPAREPEKPKRKPLDTLLSFNGWGGAGA